jgi:branched-subunit amino acid ABC-type transport system permease component
VVLWTWSAVSGVDRTGWEYVGIVEKVNPNMGWFMILPLFASGDFEIGNPYGAIVGAFIIAIPFRKWGAQDEPDRDRYVTLLQNSFLYPIVRLMSADYKSNCLQLWCWCYYSSHKDCLEERCESLNFEH